MKKPVDSSKVWERGNRAKWQLRFINTATVLVGVILIVVIRLVLNLTPWGKSLPLSPYVRSLIANCSTAPVAVAAILVMRHLNKLRSAAYKEVFSGKVCQECGYPRDETDICPECGTKHRFPPLG